MGPDLRRFQNHLKIKNALHIKRASTLLIFQTPPIVELWDLAPSTVIAEVAASSLGPFPTSPLNKDYAYDIITIFLYMSREMPVFVATLFLLVV